MAIWGLRVLERRGLSATEEGLGLSGFRDLGAQDLVVGVYQTTGYYGSFLPRWPSTEISGGTCRFSPPTNRFASPIHAQYFHSFGYLSDK